MTEEEWLTCADPALMVEFLRGNTTNRKRKLFCCACCRRIWHLFPDARSRRAIEATEEFADNRFTSDQRGVASTIAAKVEFDQQLLTEAASLASQVASSPKTVKTMVNLCRKWVVDLRVREQCGDDYYFHENWKKVQQSEQAWQCSILQCIHGTLLFRPIALCSEWSTDTVLRIATAAYEDRAFDRLPILADALEEAACTNADILNHCRQPGVHVRGCWVVDLLLNMS